MQSVFSYAGYNHKDRTYDFSRAYRETLIYQTINTFEQEYVPDNAIGVEDYTRKERTLEEKRRLRNEIMRYASDSVRDIEDPAERAKALCDPETIENAFFETNYGKQFAGQRDAFNATHRDRNRDVVASWTTRQEEDLSDIENQRLRMTISPYDPQFAGADGFDRDQIGYLAFAGKVKEGEVNGEKVRTRSIGIAKGDVVPLDGEFTGKQTITQAPRADGKADYMITGVHFKGSDKLVTPYSDAEARTMREEEPATQIYGESELSGYNILARYIKKKDAKRDVRNLLVDAMNDGRRLSSDEREFMSKACRYFSENGMDFDIGVQDGYVVANLGSRRQVRLYDRDEPEYQGRIYDNGLVGYASFMSKKNLNSESNLDEKLTLTGTITAQDRINAIDHYFGGTPDIVNDSSMPGYSHVPVGANIGVKATGGARFYGSSGSSFQTAYKTASGNVTKIALAIHDLDASAFDTKDNAPNTVVVNLRIDPKESRYTGVLPNLSDDAFRAGKVSNDGPSISDVLSDNLYPEDMYPSDCTYDEEYDDYYMKATVPPEHAEWYRHAVARNTLEDWVNSAKDTHAQRVNIDDIVDKFEQYGTDGYEYPYDGDERIAEIQKLYWDVLAGTKSTGKAKKSSNSEIDGTEEEDIDAQIELDAFDSKVFSMSTAEKKEEIKKHYDKYADAAFGRVPKLVPPADFGLTREQIDDIHAQNEGAGFNPTMVARYTSVEASHSVQRNYDFIRHMLKEMGDDYNSSFVKDNTYIGNEIRKDMIKYDQSSAACSHYSQELDRYTGIPYRKVYDGKTVDYDKLYEYAPGLKDKPVTTEMLLHTADTLYRSGCDINSIEVNVDDNGIISYRAAQRQVNASKADTVASYDPRASYAPRGVKVTKDSATKYDPNFTLVSGEIGQVFEPDKNGVIIPKYESSKPSKVIIPGYDAYLVENDPDDMKPMRDRLRLSDWQHQMKQAISSEIHKATFGSPAQYNFIQHTTSLNSVYRHTYDMEMTEQEYREKLDPELSSPEEVETFKNVITTLRGRCRFPNEYGDGSTTTAQSYLEHPTEEEARRFDYYYSDLCDNTNLRTMGPQFDGIFDANMTGTAKNQGIVRYLADGVTVDSATGKVNSVEVTDPSDPPRCALLKDKLFEFAENDAWDRRQMSTNMALTALRTPRNVGVAMMTFEGDTFDDGNVISAEYANRNQVRGENGEFRPLMVQDKLSDCHGNKGVISRVVRRDQWSGVMVNAVDVNDITDYNDCKATYEGKEYSFRLDPSAIEENNPDNPRENQIKMQATKAIQKQLGIDDNKCKVFYDNPDLDVVVSPYSGMSRANGGTVCELMRNPSDLIVNGEKIEGGMGRMNMIVVNMLADKKTHWYDEDAVSEGKGRKASGQLLWQLEAKGATAIIDEFYGKNTSSWDSFREYAIVTGFDINEDLEPVVGYHEQTKRGEHRRLFELPPSEEISDALSVNIDMKTNVVNASKMRKYMDSSTMQSEMNKTGGFMELPFQLDFKTFERTADNIPNDVKEQMRESFKTPVTGNDYAIGDKTYPTYGLPVLPPGLRSGQDFKDGTARNHDYTTWYMDIYKSALTYVAVQGELEKPDLTAARKRELEEALDKTKASAQAKFDKIVSDVIDKQFNTKHNVVRDNVFTAKIPSSATAVVSADAKLKSDEVAMSREHAVQLGIMDYDAEKDEYHWANRKVDENGNEISKGNGAVLIWRDPLLREGGVRYMNVVIDDSVTGIKMNPAMGKSFDGDFDGDSYGVIGLKTRAAQKEAFEKFHVSNNMLDLGAGRDPKTGMYPLFISSGMDITAKMFRDKNAGGDLSDRFDNITRRANDVQNAIENGTTDTFTYDARVPMTRKKSVKNPKTGEVSERTVLVRDKDGNTVYEKNADGTPKRQTLVGEAAINACKRETKDDLDKFLSDAYTGIGVDHIIVKDPSTVVASVQRIVDSGAKGNASKMRDFMDNVGIDYQVGEDGRADPSTARRITAEINGQEKPVSKLVMEGIENGDDRARKHDVAIQETAAYKADNTALGGTSSQNGVCAFRNYNLHEILELTYPTTQSILQSKHDPADAKVKDEIVRFWGHDVWDGYALTGNWDETDPKKLQETAHERKKVLVKDGNGNPIPVRDPAGVDENGKTIYKERVDNKGNPVYETTYEKCDKEQWIKQMRGMMSALKVTVNDEYIKTLADAMYDKDGGEPLVSAETGKRIYGPDKKPVMSKGGTVMGVTKFAEEHGALLDKIAYTGRLNAFRDAALSHDALYVSLMEEKGRSVPKQGSLAGNAVTKGAEAYTADFQAKQATSVADRDELRQTAAAIKAEVCNSGMPVPKAVISEKAGDLYRDETGEDKNLVHKRLKDGTSTVVEVDPVPLGRKDCRMSKADYESGEYRVMGETTAAFEQRKAAAAVKKQETPVAAIPEQTPAPVAVQTQTSPVEQKPAEKKASPFKLTTVEYKQPDTNISLIESEDEIDVSDMFDDEISTHDASKRNDVVKHDASELNDVVKHDDIDDDNNKRNIGK